MSFARSYNVGWLAGRSYDMIDVGIPVGYTYGGFEGAVFGYAAAELPRYLVALTVTNRFGVREGRQDLVFALLFTASAAGTFALDMLLQAAHVGALSRTLLAGVIPVATWAPTCWRALCGDHGEVGW